MQLATRNEPETKPLNSYHRAIIILVLHQPLGLFHMGGNNGHDFPLCRNPYKLKKIKEALQMKASVNLMFYNTRIMKHD